jgi:hypothetical protein
MQLIKISEILFEKFLSVKNKERFERAFLSVAILSFIVHLVMIGLVKFDLISIDKPLYLFNNPTLQSTHHFHSY